MVRWEDLGCFSGRGNGFGRKDETRVDTDDASREDFL